MSKTIRYKSYGLHDLAGGVLSPELKTLTKNCIEHQKLAAAGAFSAFQPREDALDLVDTPELERILASNANIHGISSEESISNVITFGARHIEGAVLDDELNEKRALVDEGMTSLVSDLFTPRKRYRVVSSGHFWYPKGAWMGWHTNSRAPGWRIYINYAEEPGESFLRYRDPASGEIRTLVDREWNVRVFRVTREKPLWHCVYSNTNRFSLGYMIPELSIKSRLLARLKR